MKTIIEVGSNQGQDTERFLKEEDTMVYAFEPVPNLAFDLHNKFFCEKLRVIMAAVDLENGWKKFNVSNEGDWGCSSLYDYSDTPGPQNLSILLPNVMCIRLDTFMDLYGIEKIDYLHVDAQGNDFRVLQSLGDKIDLVDAGVVEVANKTKYYNVEDNHVDIVKPWLEEHGFEVRVEDDGVGKEMASVTGNEVNLFFRRIR